MEHRGINENDINVQNKKFDYKGMDRIGLSAYFEKLSI